MQSAQSFLRMFQPMVLALLLLWSVRGPACRASIPLPVRCGEELRQYCAKSWRSAPSLKGNRFHFVPLFCCLFRIYTLLGVHIRTCFLYTELISQKTQFHAPCWHFACMAWYKAESNNAEMSGSEGAMKSLNSDILLGTKGAIFKQSFAAGCALCWPSLTKSHLIWAQTKNKQKGYSLWIYFQFSVIKSMATGTMEVFCTAFFRKESTFWGWHIKPKNFQEKVWPLRQSNDNGIMPFVFGP